MIDLIVYHGGCSDGFCAAYIAKKVYPDAEMFPAYYSGEMPDVLDRKVLMLDFAYPRGVLNQMHNMAKALVVLDHHKTAQEELAGFPWATFDMTRSGATMAWDYFHSPEPRPWYVRYVEDRDLWKFVLPCSREVSAYLGTIPYTVEAWDRLAQESLTQGVISKGEGVLSHIQQYVEKVKNHARGGMLNGYSVAIVNTAYPNISEVGEALVNDGAEISIGYFERNDGMFQFSLRSKKGGPDVSAIAKTFPGGGGHVTAAGFELPYVEGRKLVDKILGREE
jgi:oligoribonuclease NrnB/cAMP/cGMP phosphodiesterase (DHH superfamily)